MNEALWALGRGTGVASLLLITVALVLGLVTRSGRPLAGLPRFSVALVHRNVSLLACIFVVIHVVSLFFDPYAQLNLVDFVVPFLGADNPFWLGLGTLSVDLLLAVTITSLFRRRIGQKVFRAVHWFTYAMFPVALLHSVFDGSDGTTVWLVALAIACIAAVLGGVVWRLSARFRENPSDKRLA